MQVRRRACEYPAYFSRARTYSIPSTIFSGSTCCFVTAFSVKASPVSAIATSQGISEAIVEKGFFKTARPSSLIKRFATPEEVANLVVYVASPKSSATNGASLRVDGGVVRSIL